MTKWVSISSGTHGKMVAHMMFLFRTEGRRAARLYVLFSPFDKSDILGPLFLTRSPSRASTTERSPELRLETRTGAELLLYLAISFFSVFLLLLFLIRIPPSPPFRCQFLWGAPEQNPLDRLCCRMIHCARGYKPDLFKTPRRLCLLLFRPRRRKGSG